MLCNSYDNWHYSVRVARRFAKWQKAPPLWYVGSDEGRAQSLYRLAMLWLAEKGGVSDDRRAAAALSLSLWICDDLEASSSSTHYLASMLSQPIHLSLGYLAAFDPGEAVVVPDLEEILNDPKLQQMLGGSRLRDLLPHYLDYRSNCSSTSDVLVNTTDASTCCNCSSSDVLVSNNNTSDASLSNWYSDWFGLLATSDHAVCDALFYLPELYPLVVAGMTYDVCRQAEAGGRDVEVESSGSNDRKRSDVDDPVHMSCIRGISHYLSVSNFVEKYFGTVETGVGLLQDVRLHWGPPEGFHGKEDLIHQHTEADALNGDAEAQTWLGKMYFWGFGGLHPDLMEARRWFERAAALGDPEGLYNIGE